MPSQSNISGSRGSETEIVVRGNRVVTPDGERAAAILIQGGVIAKVSDFRDVSHATEIYEARDFAIMPGLVATHVHINEPGRTEWEGFATATRAASAGGITTLIEMPLNSIPATTSLAAFEAKAAATEGQIAVDVALTGGVVPGNVG